MTNLSPEEETKELISLKKQFITEASDYEKKVILLFASIAIGLVIYFYKNPNIGEIEVNWVLVAICAGSLVSMYETFAFLSIQGRYNEMQNEIKNGNIRKVDAFPEGLGSGAIWSVFRKSPHLFKIKFYSEVVVIVLTLVAILKPFIAAKLGLG